MSRFNPKQRLWIIIIALLVVVIILGSYYLFVNSYNDSVEVLSPDDVVNNSGRYVDKNITVVGYFYHEGADGRGVITSSLIPQSSSLADYTLRLPVDYSNVDISPQDKVKYRFTGVLIEEEGVGNPVVLVAKEIVQV